MATFHELPFSLNLGDRPNDAQDEQQFIIISSKYRRLVPSKFKEKLMKHFLRGSKIKPRVPNIS